MAKVGGPSLPPVVPSTRPAEAPISPARVDAQPPPQPVATPARTPADLRPPPANPANLAQVANQFGSAFMSAGKLASQLVKNLASNVPLRKPANAETAPGAEKARKAGEELALDGQQFDNRPEVGSRKEGADHGSSGRDGRQGAQQELPQGAVGAAFAALRNSRLFRARLKKKKGAGRTGRSRRKDDYEEEERERHVVRNWMKGDADETPFDQGRREAMRLQQLDKQGESPAQIGRELNAQLGVTRDDGFRDSLSETLQPQLDAMAERVEALPDGERRTMSALFARAQHQVGRKSAVAYEKLLRATATAEAQSLPRTGTASFDERIELLTQALRRAASSQYRASLIEAAAPEVGQLALELSELDTSSLLPALEAVLRAAAPLHGPGAERMAAAFAEGLNASGDREGAWSRVLGQLGPALAAEPSGGVFAFELFALAPLPGEGAAALRQTLRSARAQYTPLVTELRNTKPTAPGPAAAAVAQAKSDALKLKLDVACAPAVQLVPGCARALELLPRLPRERIAELQDEVYCLLGSLDVFATTHPGQRLLRVALVEQERGDLTFLEAMPRIGKTLGQPKVVAMLVSQGYPAQAFDARGHILQQRLALQLSRALAGPVFARLRKRDMDGGLRLLRSGLRANAALYSVTPDGARQLCTLCEEVISKGNATLLEKTMARVSKILTNHALEKIGNGDTLRPLVLALLQERTPPEPKKREGSQVNEARGELNVSQIAAAQAQLAQARAKEQERPAAKPAVDPRRTLASAGPLRASELAAAVQAQNRTTARPAPPAASPATTGVKAGLGAAGTPAASKPQLQPPPGSTKPTPPKR